jgi:oligopeptidase B
VLLASPGTPQSDDILLFEDLNKLFNVYHCKSVSKEYLFLATESIETAEVHMIYLKHVNGAEGHRHAASQQKVIQSKIPKLRYSIEHHESYFYLLTNLDECHNSKLMRVPVSSSDLSSSQWKEVTPYAETRELSHMLAFKTGLVIFGRENGSQKIWRLLAASAESGGGGSGSGTRGDSTALDSSVATLDGSMIFINSANDIPCPHPQWSEIVFPEACYSVRSRNNVRYDTPVVRVDYSSFVTPKSTIDINFHTNEQTVLKRKEVPNYLPENYTVRRIFAPSNHTEGCLIPISLVFHRSLLQTNPAATSAEDVDSSFPVDRPMLLYGYGSYGACIDPSFDYTRLPLLDRGVVYAIAHIRGGGEMGRSQWYEHGGKYFNKMNTFRDFKDCALELIRRQITSSDRLAIVGRSAGTPPLPPLPSLRDPTLP